LHWIARKALLILATTSLIASLFAVLPVSSTVQAYGVPDDATLYPHDPIWIDGDTIAEAGDYSLEYLFASHPLWNGTGTEEDPYLIENQTIDAEDYGAGVYISNTTSYLVIRNCTVINAGLVIPSPEYYGGIVLNNTANVTIFSCEIHDNFIGIFMQDSQDDAIINNNCSDNFFGIMLNYSCNENIIEENTVNETFIGIYLRDTNEENVILSNHCAFGLAGIFLLASSNNYVIHNNCSDNAMGIMLDESSDNNYLIINYCNDSDADGIWINDSCNNWLISNECHRNGYADGSPYYAGIHLEYADENTLANNNCSDNDHSGGAYASGIFLNNSNHNEILDNVCLSNYKGIWLNEYSDNNTVAGNNCSSNSYGIHMVHSNNNTIQNNALRLNAYGSYAGIYTQYSNYNKISNNVLTDNVRGIYLSWHSGHNIVENNYCDGNSERDISLDAESNYNWIMNNTCSGSNYGIRLFGVQYNLVENNTCYSNSYGVYLTWGAQYNTVANNTIRDNSYYGIVIDLDSNYNRIYGNHLMNNNGVSDAYDPTKVQAYDGCTNFWNSTGFGNVWSDLQSPDTNGDGIVDVPYEIAGGENLDNYPLVLSMNVNAPTSPFYTNASTVAISGNGSAYGLEDFTWYNELTGESGACMFTLGTHNWTASVPLEEGINTINLTMINEFGRSISREIIVYYDIVQPTVELTRPSDGDQYALDEVSVAWRAYDALSGVNYSMISIDGGEWIRVDGTRYNIVGLSDGEHTVQVMVYDRAGNWILSDIVSFTIDTEGPEVTITSPDDGSYVIDDEVTVEWTATDLVAVSYYVISVDGSDFVMVHDTSYVLGNLADGNHVVIVGAYDVLGNYGETMIEFIVDTVEPEVIVSPTGEGVDIDAVIIAQFSKAMNESSVSIVVNGVTGQLIWIENTATFVPSALEYNRQYTVTVSGYDLAGHYVEEEWNFSTMVKIGNVEGVVVDANGKALSNVTVTLENGWTATTNSTGHFVFEGVNIGEYNVTFSKDGYVTGSGNVTIVADHTDDMGTITLATKPVSSDVNIVLVIAVLAIFGAIIGAAYFYVRKK